MTHTSHINIQQCHHSFFHLYDRERVSVGTSEMERIWIWALRGRSVDVPGDITCTKNKYIIASLYRKITFSQETRQFRMMVKINLLF